MKPVQIIVLLVLMTGLVAGLIAVWQQQLPEKRAAGAETFPCTGPLCPRAAIDLCGIPNFEWTIGNALARSGQPANSSANSSNVWRCLKNQGFTTIINQRSNEGTYTDTAEKNAVQAEGMAYIGAYRIIDNTTYSPAMLQTMMADVVSRVKKGERILVHDAGGRGRMGLWEAAFMMWDGWTSIDAINRFDLFGWKINGVSDYGSNFACPQLDDPQKGDPRAKGSNGQFQAIQSIAQDLGHPTHDPSPDTYGNRWANCGRPSYMLGYNYGNLSWPAGGGGRWTLTGVILGAEGSTPTPTRTLTPTPSPSSGPSPTPTRTLTPTRTPTPTITPTRTPTPTPSQSSGPSATPTRILSPTRTPTPQPTGWTTGERYQLLVGDVNDDNKITIDDIGRVLTKYTDFSVPVPPGTPEDVNADGAITIEDVALVLLNYIDFTVPGEAP